MTELNPEWKAVDSWWQAHVRQQEAELRTLRDRFNEFNQVWAENECLFDQDPSAEDWTETNPQAGPLRSQEENWSQWISHLLRSSPALTRQLFGPPCDTPPSNVRCEQAYHDEELHDRRVDIEVRWPTRALSIEVKINDEAYGKTPQTAYLTEQNNPEYEWQHFLLLPENKRDALIDEFGPQLHRSDDARSKIVPDTAEEGPVTVLHWKEVSQALRHVLLDDTSPSPHWTASAYLLTTLIEQKILHHYAAPSLTQYIDNTVGVSDIDRLQSIDPEAQLTYLETALEGTDE